MRTNSAFPASWNDNLPRASAAGAKFATAVLQLSNWVADPQNHNGNDYNRQSVFGGIDVEEDPAEGWSKYDVVRAFLIGYSNVTGHRPIINFGAMTVDPLCDSDACSYPGRGWTADHVVATTRQPLASSACPQVYVNKQVDNWVGLEEATGANTALHKWGGPSIYFRCILAGDSPPGQSFLPRQTAWAQFVAGIAAQKRMNFFATKISQIDTRAKAENRVYTGGASVPLQ
ncbi:MAG TPA: hypothetical protein VIL77_13470 [Gaiellaceae bacterium]